MMIRLSRAQVRRIDRLSIDRYGIPGVVLMENAARAVADLACQMLNNDCLGEILFLCGGGNNGGDGLAAARHLHNRGADVVLMTTADPEKYVGDAAINWRIARAMGLKIIDADPAAIETMSPLLIVDAIFGTGLTQEPRDPFAAVVNAIQRHRSLVLAVDIPSGLDCETGKPLGPACVVATRTITFVAEKTGFAEPTAAAYLGAVMVADIGCPRELINEILHEVPPEPERISK